MAQDPEKSYHISLLLDFYGELLSERQREIMDYYYGEDLSLSEVSALTDITRQGVRDALRRSEKLLLETEEKLGLVARFSSQREDLSYIVTRLEEISAKGEPVEDIIQRAKKML